MPLQRFILSLVLLLAWSAAVRAGTLPDGFVYLDEVAPAVRQDIRYFTRNNFLGDQVDGYLKPRAILAYPAAQALQKVQEELQPFGLGLKVFDAYRPQRAVDHFVRWARDLADQRNKAEYYPRVAKSNLFKEDYIAERSGHSRGSTVDLTLVARDGEEIDMGGRFDFFGPESWPASAAPNAGQRAHRLLLRTLMTKHGFAPYPQEWWHFTLNNEPFPQTYFDFPVQ
ncbi:MAG: M15 family metallopeptidase [Sulfuricella sp.]|nr:M15 family metallopeptidase [Sulfuricella sp.]